MRRAVTFFIAATSIATLAIAATAAEQPTPRVSFEIVTRPGVPATAAQQWYQALTELKVSGLRIRSGGGGDTPSVDRQGAADAPSFKVTGILDSDNTLYLPGGKFGVRDKGKLRTWIDNLQDSGVEGVTAARGAFGFTPSQLEAVHDDLKRPLTGSTKGVPAMQVAREIAERVRLPFQLDPGAKAALGRVTIDDELKGLACGTAMAIVLRPAGLVFRPVREQGTIRYRVGEPVAGEEAWPIGWKPLKGASKAMPGLFEMLNVEISETAVSDAVGAIEGRFDVPFIYDRTAMALHAADPTAINAEVPAKRLSYSQVLNRVLAQAQMRYELRVDEADRPFLWITTQKPAP